MNSRLNRFLGADGSHPWLEVDITSLSWHSSYVPSLVRRQWPQLGMLWSRPGLIIVMRFTWGCP